MCLIHLMLISGLIHSCFVFSLLLLVFSFYRYSKTFDSSLISLVHITLQLLFIFITFAGIFLSFFDLLGSVISWSIVFCTFSFCLLILLRDKKFLKTDKFIFNNSFYVVAFVIILIQFIRAIFTYPTNIDALTAHLPRALQYIQLGNFSITGSPYWAYDIHPLNYPVVHVFFILIFKNITSCQLLSVICSFGIYIQSIILLRYFEINRNVISLTSISIFVCVNFLLTSYSSHNEIYLGFSTWGALTFFVQYIFSRNDKYLYMFFLCSLNSIGIKQTSVYILFSFSPALIFLIVKNKLLDTFKFNGKLVLVIIIGIFIGSFSYFRNYFVFNDFLGSSKIFQHHTGTIDFNFVANDGVKNIFRYIFDIFNFDGLVYNNYSAILYSNICHSIKFNIHNLFQLLDIDLRYGFMRDPFLVSHPPSLSEFKSWYGIYGILVVLPLLCFASFFLFNKNRTGFYFYLGLVLFILINCFTSYYERARCRHMINLIPYVVIITAFIIDRYKYLRLYFKICLSISFLSTIIVLIFNRKDPFFGNNSIFARTKYDSVYEFNTAEKKIFKEIEDRVKVGNLKVGLLLPSVQVNVFYYGPNLNNKIFYLNSWCSGDSSNYEDLDVLFFSSDLYSPRLDDEFIGLIDKSKKLYFRRQPINFVHPSLKHGSIMTHNLTLSD